MKVKTISEGVKAWAVVAALLLLYGIVGRMDYEDAVMHESESNCCAVRKP